LASSWIAPPFSNRKRYSRNLIVAGLVLLVLGGVAVYDSNAATFYQSVFNLLPLKFFKITDNIKDQTTLKGSFQETSGRPVTFLIMNSAQLAAFQIGQGNASLYSVQNVATGSFSFTFTTVDQYYLVFLHGSSFLSSTETVSFQRSYYALARIEFGLAIVLLGMGVLQLYWGLRPKEMQRKAFSRETGTTHGQP
jgi:hypothetical protein